MKGKCEICESHTYLDNHHIESKSYDGVDLFYNKAYICPTCHRKVHKGDIIIEGRFSTTNGNILIWHIFGDASITGESPRVYNI